MNRRPLTEQMTEFSAVFLSLFGKCLLFFRTAEQMESMLPWLFLVTDHEAHQNLVRKSVTPSAAHCVSVSFFLSLVSGHPTTPRA